MELRITIGERSLMLLLATITGISAVGLVIAYGGSEPAIIGHSWGEMFCDKCINTSNLNDNSVTGAKIGCDSTLCRNSVSGNFGVGTASPGQKLDVVGQIRATDVCTTGGKCLNAPSFGGMYSTTNTGSGKYANPITGGYSCPAGYTDTIIMSDVDMDFGGNIAGFLHLCYKP